MIKPGPANATGLSERPRITFGIIVLNGEPFTKYCLRSLYPFAHEIVVVEGAVPGAAGIATPDGHSADGTLESLYEFKAEEDEEDKVRIVTRDGFWNEKDDMSKAYAERATGDYLWQVDVDEFYKPEDMQRVIRMLADDPSISAVSFNQIQFWGGFSFILNSWAHEVWAAEFHRLFRWGPGYVYKAHRPPTVTDHRGEDMRQLHWIRGQEMERHGVFVYHYSFVFPCQVRNKSKYYKNAEWCRLEESLWWAEEVWVKLRHPYSVANLYYYPSWLEAYEGDHPPQIRHLLDDMESGVIKVDRRPTDDIERLLQSSGYRLGRRVLKYLAPLAKWYERLTPSGRRHNWPWLLLLSPYYLIHGTVFKILPGVAARALATIKRAVTPYIR